jgi:hypothetical protein
VNDRNWLPKTWINGNKSASSVCLESMTGYFDAQKERHENTRFSVASGVTIYTHESSDSASPRAVTRHGQGSSLN